MAKRSTEVERKWLVPKSPALSKLKHVKIVQGYLPGVETGTEVRLRKEDNKYFETIKVGSGLERDEWEVELSRKQFKVLWPMTRGRRLAKTRYNISYKGKRIELDIYRRNLHGLKRLPRWNLSPQNKHDRSHRLNGLVKKSPVSVNLATHRSWKRKSNGSFRASSKSAVTNST